MYDILIPAVLNVAALIGCGFALWVGQDNHKIPSKPFNRPADAQLKAFNRNAIFRFVDRIPLLRRSGKATVNDLAKGLFITLLIAFLPQALFYPLTTDLWASAFLFTLFGGILFMHPSLSHRQSFAENARGQSPFKSKS